jgi:outer membrane protein
MKQAILLCVAVALFVGRSRSQTEGAADTLLPHATLKNCVQYALVHQPLLKQSALDEEIVDHTISRKLDRKSVV